MNTVELKKIGIIILIGFILCPLIFFGITIPLYYLGSLISGGSLEILVYFGIASVGIGLICAAFAGFFTYRFFTKNIY